MAQAHVVLPAMPPGAHRVFGDSVHAAHWATCPHACAAACGEKGGRNVQHSTPNIAPPPLSLQVRTGNRRPGTPSLTATARRPACRHRTMPSARVVRLAPSIRARSGANQVPAVTLALSRATAGGLTGRHLVRTRHSKKARCWRCVEAQTVRGHGAERRGERTGACVLMLKCLALLRRVSSANRRIACLMPAEGGDVCGGSRYARCAETGGGQHARWSLKKRMRSVRASPGRAPPSPPFLLKLTEVCTYNRHSSPPLPCPTAKVNTASKTSFETGCEQPMRRGARPFTPKRSREKKKKDRGPGQHLKERGRQAVHLLRHTCIKPQTLASSTSHRSGSECCQRRCPC